jgi:hypothetical protein
MQSIASHYHTFAPSFSLFHHSVQPSRSGPKEMTKQKRKRDRTNGGTSSEETEEVTETKAKEISSASPRTSGPPPLIPLFLIPEGTNSKLNTIRVFPDQRLREPSYCRRCRPRQNKMKKEENENTPDLERLTLPQLLCPSRLLPAPL